jgi:hypothetical protein
MWFCRAALAQALAGELDAIGVVQETVEDGVGDGGITQHGVLPQRLTV